MKKMALLTIFSALVSLGMSSCSNPDGTDGFKESMHSKPDRTDANMNPSPEDSDSTQEYEMNYPHDTVPETTMKHR